MSSDDVTTTSENTTDQTITEQTAAAALAVTTDKADYAPGETATFTATGVATGGSVTFNVDHVIAGEDGVVGTADDTLADDVSGTAPFTVTDGGEGDLDGEANGQIVTSWLVNQDAANQAFALTATGDNGETATTTFTDSGKDISINAVTADDAISAAEIGTGFVISGTTEHVANGTTVTVVLDGVAYTGTVSGATGAHLSDGQWSVTVSAAQAATLTDGPFEIIARVDSDDADSIDDLIGTRTITVDAPGSLSVIDVTDQNDTGTANGAIFTNDVSIVDATGIGNFEGFLVIQDSPVEEGFNTDGDPLPLDAKEVEHTNALLLNDIPIVIGDGTNGTTDGTVYREFRLDIAENSSGPQPISLDELKIHQGSTGGLLALPGTALYDLDSGGDKTILLDAQWGSGSGHGDYVVLIPDSVFDHSGDNPYVYLFSKFGVQGGEYAAAGANEEWGVAATAPSIDLVKDAVVLASDDPDDIADDQFVDSDTDYIKYTVSVTNNGDTPLTGVEVKDSFEGGTPLTMAALGAGAPEESGDGVHGNGILEVGETWTYTYIHDVTEAEINTALADDEDFDNTATVTTDQGVGDQDDETVPVVDGGGGQGPAGISIVKTTQDLGDDGLDAPDATEPNDGTPGDGITILAGEDIRWLYTVTNTGEAALENVTVTDSDAGVTATFDSEVDGNGDAVFDPGEVWLFTANGTAVAGELDENGDIVAYTNTAIANADVVGSDESTESDPDGSSYVGLNPHLTLDKTTQDLGSDGLDDEEAAPEDQNDGVAGDGNIILAGEQIRWVYTLTNDGNVELANIVVMDDNGTVDDGDADNGDETLDDFQVGTIESLAAGDSITLYRNGTAVAGQLDENGDIIPYVNTATATTDDVTDDAGHKAPVNAEDDSSYYGADPSIEVIKYVSVDGGQTWEDANSATGPFLTDVSPYDPMFKFVVHNTGNVDLTDIKLEDSDFNLSSLANGTTIIDNGDGTITINNLAADDGDDIGPDFGPDTIELTITEPWHVGQHTDTAEVSATYTDSAGHDRDVGDTDDANYFGIDVGRLGLTKGYWGQHLEAWDGQSTNVTVKKGYDTNRWDKNVGENNDLSHKDMLLFETTPGSGVFVVKDSNGDGAITSADIGVLLGDVDGNGINFNDLDGDFKFDAADGETIIENTLFVSLTAAQQIILSSDSATDTRQILMSQALAAQLNINNGAQDPLNLVGEAVAWLKGQAPYVYTDNSTGRVDSNGDGILSVGNNNTFEYNTNTKAFTFDANGAARSGSALTSNLQAWQQDVDVWDPVAPPPGPNGFDQTASGEDLKNALEYFNKGMLATSADGTQVFWTTDGGATVDHVHDNTLDQFWLTLFEAGKVA